MAQTLTLKTEFGAIQARIGQTLHGNGCLRISKRAARKLGTRDASRLPLVAGYGEWIGVVGDDFVCFAIPGAA
jgi:hypothetical protein